MKKTLLFAFIAFFSFNGLHALNLNPFSAMKKGGTGMRNVMVGERLCQPKLVDEIKHGLPEYQKSHNGINGHVIHSNRNNLKKSQALEKKMQMLVKCTGNDTSKAKTEKLAKNHAKFAQHLSSVCRADPQFGGMFSKQCQVATQADAYLHHKKIRKKSRGSLFSRMTGRNKSADYYTDYDQQYPMYGNQNGFPAYGQQQAYGNQNSFPYGQQQPYVFGGQLPAYGNQGGLPGYSAQQPYGNQNGFPYGQQQPYVFGGQLPAYGNQGGLPGYSAQQPYGYNNVAPSAPPMYQQDPYYGAPPSYAPPAAGYTPQTAYAQPYQGYNQQALPYAQASYPPMPYYAQSPQSPVSVGNPASVATTVPQAYAQGGTSGQIVGSNPSQGIICSCP